MKRFLSYRRSWRFVIGLAIALVSPMAAQQLTFTEILGRPEAHSITLSIMFDQPANFFIQYGTGKGGYALSTVQQNATAGVPYMISFTGLNEDTRYYYRVAYKKPLAPDYQFGPERTFHTQRAKGSTFTFTIEADPHPYDKKGSHTLFYRALRNQLNDSGDFLIDLGDTFGDDRSGNVLTSEQMRVLHANLRPFFGSVCHSSPLILCLGNHEGESGYYLLQTPPDNLGVYGTLWRKYYFPNPVPDEYYLGNTSTEDFGMGSPENYFAWEWGDALFVVLDAYRYYTISAKPRGWDWTLGKTQYDWLKQTLESSKAKYRFVFAHHTLGETRGGEVTARLYEWGGFESDLKTWGFTANRSGWAMPIHQLMEANGVNIYFQGHDHVYAVEEVGGIVYQAVPMPSDSTYLIGVTDNGSAYPGFKLDGAGHLRVTVSPESVDVAYIEARLAADEDSLRWNGHIAHSYSVKAKATEVLEEAAIPSACTLGQNFPNPFNPFTVIRYQLSTNSQVALRVYDVLGREVVTLVDDVRPPGISTVTFDGTGLPSGVYFYRLMTGTVSQTRTMVLTR